MPEKISEVINLLLLLIRWMGKKKILNFKNKLATGLK